VPWRRGRGRSGPQNGTAAGRPPALLRHPRLVLAAAAALLAALAIFGANVEDRLEPTSLDIPGTNSSRANAMLRAHFGNSAPFAILLRGPARAIDRQGPGLIRALRRDPAVTTLSPWDRGSVQHLRPGPRRALVLVDFHVGISEAVNDVVPRLDRILERRIRAPVRATQTGFASLSRALQEESIDASERGELIALPALLIVLLLVFRSPIAAAIPLAFGAVAVVASRGLLHFLTAWLDIDAFALTVCTMMGLALGVDYALLMVSRFREELAAGAAPVDAAWATRRTAGRTTAFAGTTLMLSMVVALFIVPGALLASLAGTVALVVALTVLVATVAGPALLTLVGPNLDRWRIGPPAGGRSRLMKGVTAALRRPLAVAVLIGGIVLVLAVPALGLKTGPPSPEQLSGDDPARQDAELVDRAIGPGWDAPFEIVATTRNGPITDPSRLAALTRWQRRLAKLPGVHAVIGPAQVAKRVVPLREQGKALLASNGDICAVDQLARLGRNLRTAAGGVGQLREGLARASYGAGLLAQGSGRAAQGARAIADGLGTAGAGSRRAVGALERFAAGTKKLTRGLFHAALGERFLRINVHNIVANLAFNGLRRSRKLDGLLEADAEHKLPQLTEAAGAADEQLKTAFQLLGEMSVGRSDPHYQAALEAVRRAEAAVGGTDPVGGQPYAPEYSGLPTELTGLGERLQVDVRESKQVTAWLTSEIINLKKIFKLATRLVDGLEELHKGTRQLREGSRRLASAADRLNSGLGRLGHGADSLAGGIARLEGGAASLEENLAAGFGRSAPLESGLRRAGVSVLAGRTRIRHRIARAHRKTPGIFDSGYFVLSAAEGAPPKAREAASAAIDLRHGGQAAVILVISRYTFNTPGSIGLNRHLERVAEEISDDNGLRAGVAGGAAELNDYSHVTGQRLPYVVAAITIVTFLLLVAILRALPLALIAVGLNLATVGVAFGVLTLLSHLPADAPLGGHTYVDAVGATAIFGVVFGLSIDYAVFLLSRMREHYDEHGDNRAAIMFGLDRTARVITGAAAIMMAVFVAFAGAPIATVSQLGIGLTVAVLLDATVVRIVLLPALMLLLGDRVWWLPGPLRRALPRFSV
jgi:RND superfamily putative drug exporter